jgi:hypothetical protein
VTKTFPERDHLKIGPFSYKVKVKKKVYAKDGTELYGQILYPNQTVEYQKGLSLERTAAIVLHEALHGIDEAIGVGLSEKQVTKLGIALAGFLLDNDLLRTEES